jgi:hypothetical protein
VSLDYGNQFRDGVQVVWNSHSFKAWETCERYYYYTVIEGWTGARNVHFDFGGAYAGAMHAFYLAKSQGADREEAIRAAVRTALTLTWDGEAGAPIPFDHPTKDRGSLIRTIVWYFEEFKDDLPVLQIDGKPAVELRVSAEADGGNTLVGTIDRVVLYDGAPFVMDQKTTKSTLSSYYFRQYKPDTQMSQYTFLGNIVFAEPVKGVLIDAAQIAVGFSRFMRSPTYRTQSELQEWYDTAMLRIEEAQRATREHHFPMRPSACHQYGGCAFLEICSQAPEVRKNFLAAKFTKEKN